MPFVTLYFVLLLSPRVLCQLAFFVEQTRVSDLKGLTVVNQRKWPFMYERLVKEVRHENNARHTYLPTAGVSRFAFVFKAGCLGYRGKHSKRMASGVDVSPPLSLDSSALLHLLSQPGKLLLCALPTTRLVLL